MLKRLLPWIVLCCFSSLICAAAEPTLDVAPLLEIVREKSALIADWESAARLQIFLTLAGIIFGGLITLLQPWGSSRWCKMVAGSLGLAAAGVTAFISKAPVSYSAYERSALQARAKISALSDTIHFLKANSDPDSKRTLQEEFTETVKEINQIELKLSGDDKSVASLLSRGGVAYAESTGSKAPAWVTKVTESATEWYFRGESEDRSLAEAKSNARLEALQRCTQLLISQGKVGPDEALAYASNSTVAADTFFTFSDQTQTYRYYVLLRLDKSLTRPEVIATLSGSPTAPTDKKALSACTMRKLNDGEVAAFQVGVRQVYVYLVRQSQQWKPLIPKLLPDVGDLMVSVKPQNWIRALAVNYGLAEFMALGATARVSAKGGQALRQDTQAYVETKLENGKSFMVNVEGEKIVVSIETHYVKHFANITVCHG